MAIRKSLAKRYAKALIATARTDAEFDPLARDLDAFALAVSQSAELRDALLSPTVRATAKTGIAREVAAKLGSTAHVLKLVELVIAAHRFDHFAAIVECFHDELDRRRGLVRGEVLAAQPIDAAGLARVNQALATALGKTVVLEQRRDEALIGGLQVRVGGVIIDGSIRGRIDRLVEQMKG